MAEWVKLDHKKISGKAKELKEFLEARLVGQDRAVSSFASAMSLYEADLRRPDRPIYTVLLSGPSGVGKTRTAELLAEFFFGSSQALTKVACSDFQASHDISALIGSPAGYVGFWNPSDPNYPGVEPILSQYNVDKYDFFRLNDEDKNNAEAIEANEKIINLLSLRASLIKILFDLNKKAIEDKKKSGSTGGNEAMDLEKNPAMRQVVDRILQIELEVKELGKKLRKDRKNYSPSDSYRSVVLFDEIEKANQALHNLLLEIMDKGRISLKNGQVTSFKNSFLVLTSNIGSSEISKILSKKHYGYDMEKDDAEEKTDQKIYDAVWEETKKVFPAFFLGRLNKTIVFRPLSRVSLAAILEMQIKELQNSLIKSKFGVKLEIDAEVKEFFLGKALEHMDQGVRILSTRLEHDVAEKLSNMKTSGELKEGDAIRVALETVKGKEKIVFYRASRVSENGLGIA